MQLVAAKASPNSSVIEAILCIRYPLMVSLSYPCLLNLFGFTQRSSKKKRPRSLNQGRRTSLSEPPREHPCSRIAYLSMHLIDQRVKKSPFGRLGRKDIIVLYSK